MMREAVNQGFRPAFAVPIEAWTVAYATLGSKGRACSILHLVSSKRNSTLNTSTNRFVEVTHVQPR